MKAVVFRQVGTFWLAVCALILTCAPVLAQPEVANSEEPAPEKVAPASSSPSVRQVGFDLYIIEVRDENGELVLVPNITLEKLMEIWNLMEGLANPGPPLPTYALQDLSITGTATGKQAKLTATITIRPLRDGLVRVPLGFSNAFLQEAKYDGDGEPIVIYEKDDGHVCYVQAPKDKLHTLSLQLIAPVRQVGSEMRLALQTPRGVASSGLNLRVPLKEVTATASNDLPVSVQKQGEETLLVVTGLGDAFQVAWREGKIEPTDVKPPLEVRSEAMVNVVGQRNVNSEMRLLVSSEVRLLVSSDVHLPPNSRSGKFKSFDVRLPDGARLAKTQPNQSGLTVSEAAGEDKSEAAGKEESKVTLLHVQLDQPTSGPVEVQLSLDFEPKVVGKESEFEIGGLDVVDAVRQSGWIDVDISDKVSDYLSVVWEADRNVKQTLVPEDLREIVDARFEFFRSPSSLRMLISERVTEINVEPTYVLHVESSRVVLDATLKYRVRGAAPSSVKVSMPDWQVGRVSPDTLLNDETFDPEHSGQLEVPLRRLESDRFELEIRATQEIADPSAVVTLSLPRPDDVKVLTPAAVVVLPADNVELTVEEGGLKGLERESFPPQIDDLPPRQQAPLHYRERHDATTDADPTVFAARLRVRKRAVSVGSDCEMKVDLRSVRVKQEIRYRIVYEPLSRIPLIVPRSVLETGGLSILCDDQPMPFDEVKLDEDDSPANAGPARIQVDLQRARIGSCDIVVEHKHILSDLVPGQDNFLQVPIVVPESSEETTVRGSTLTIPPSEDAQVEVAEGEWAAVEEGTESLDGEQVLKSSAVPSFASLRISRSKPRRQMSTTISRAWIQTWLDSTRRHERAVFRVRTNRNEIEIRLPDQATIEDVALDGHRVPDLAGEVRSITVKLPGESALGEHVVELWYHMAHERGFIDRVGVDPPVVADAEGSNRWYWQLAMPPGEHLLNSPTGMTSEMMWKQQGLLWERHPRIGQAEIERWIGASAQTPVPEALNHYLFSSFGEVSKRECATADRRAILLIVSGFALLSGLALIYVPRLRNPGLLFAAGVALISAVVLYPGLSVGIAQASCLGLILIATAGLLKWLVDLPQTRGVLIRGTPYSSPDSKTVKGPASPIDSHAARQTSTIPAPTPASAAESST